MTTTTRAWEKSLLSLAYEKSSTSQVSPRTVEDREVLERAYAYCRSITAVHSRSFYMASRLLPSAKCRDIQALYAFCRITDDLVDDPPPGQEEPEALFAALEAWRTRTLAWDEPPPAVSFQQIADARDLVVLAWRDVCSRFCIPQHYAQQFINTIGQDITRPRYETFADLAAYCYGVASTVGLMSMYIIGFCGPRAVPYALKLGVALQLTNILRDIGEDWRAGRLYLPLEELRLFGLCEEDIEAGIVNDRWRAFMEFQIERNRQLYAEAWPGIALLHADGRFSIAAAAELYRAILQDIERHDFDVFSRRAHVSIGGKLRRLPAIWWRSRSMRPPA